MNLFESLSLNNVRHIIHQRLYTKLIQNKAKTKQKKCKERTQPKTKKSQMGAYYTLIIVWLDKKLLYHNQLKV